MDPFRSRWKVWRGPCSQVAVRLHCGEEAEVYFRVELVWQDDRGEDAPSIYLTADGRVILQGAALSPQERA